MPTDISSRREAENKTTVSKGSLCWQIRLLASATHHHSLLAHPLPQGAIRRLHLDRRPTSSVFFSLCFCSLPPFFLFESCHTDNLAKVMMSLAIGSGLMIAVTIRYVQSRQKFTQWSPPKFNSATTSEGGTMTSGTYNSNAPTTSTARKGLYDRWLMVRFTIAFILLA